MHILTQPQRHQILDHMISPEDSKTRNRKYKARKNTYDTLNIELNELLDYVKEGWEEITRTSRRVSVQRQKEPGRRFEHDMWCMFYDLGFEILNLDENLQVQWGPNKGDHQQLDVVAVRDDAIFVVECKATDVRKSASFKKDIEALSNYKDGVAEALQQIYGDKRVKFVFATRGYTFKDDSEDLNRLGEMGVYHFNENSYNYVRHLIGAYKTSVIYQFMGLMFKDELIDDQPIRIPALEGEMGGHKYYMLAIEPAKLLKIGFVLHRTKINQTMAPTYQRLLVPSRLKGITKFIDDGGYFPNSIIVNFDLAQKGLELKFEPQGGENSHFGNLVIPNAYGIAYIIDGQHRLYGYANTQHKDTNTIPVVAFCNMDSQEQLRIFMDINENQKAVSPSLRLDLAEDINWDSSRPDSRMVALRSSIIKKLACNANGVLYQKISVGEDSANLSFLPFATALLQSSLLPKATQTQFKTHLDVCLYDTSLANASMAMEKAKTAVANLINDTYEFLKANLKDDVYTTFIECNRGTYPTVVILGNINEHLIRKGEITQTEERNSRFNRIKPYLLALCHYLNDIPEEDKTNLLRTKGQGAETLWLRTFQSAIQKLYKEFNPIGLTEWQQSQNETLQEEGKKIGEEIERILKELVFRKLEELHGDKWEKSIPTVKANCIKRIADASEDLEESDWKDYVNPNDLLDIIDKQWLNRKENDTDSTFVPFSKTFNLTPNPRSNSKKEQLKWLGDFLALRKAWTTAKSSRLTQANVNDLKAILLSLPPLDDSKVFVNQFEEDSPIENE